MTTTKLALFDLDHTLLPIDSDYQWGCFMAAQQLVDGAAFLDAHAAFSGQYQNGTLDSVAYTRFAFSYLKMIPRKVRKAQIERFIVEVVEPSINQAARDLVKRFQDEGAVCVLTSATNVCITEPIARLFNLPVIGPEPELDSDGEMTGELAGPDNMGPRKVTNAKRWLVDQGMNWTQFTEIHAYSDSENDIPLLAAATHAVVTNPTAGLARYGKQQAWPELWLYPKTI